MKRISTILLVLALCLDAAKGQTPVVTMTTSNFIGSNIFFSLQANTDNTPIQVDFGDGSLVNQTVGTSLTYINGTINGSQTVKIYGTGITYIDCSGNMLTSLDVTKFTDLITLKCLNNQLTSLDVTKNTALTVLW